MLTEEDIKRLFFKDIEGKSLSQVSEKYGVTPALVSYIKNGKRGIGEKIANVLGYVKKEFYIKKQ